MDRDTCIECERKFLKIINHSDIDTVLEGTLYDIDIDHTICIKCLVRIINRFITK